MNNKKRIIILIKVIAVSLALLGLIAVLDKDGGKDEAYTKDGYYLYDFVMGTASSCHLYGDEEIAKKAASDVNCTIKALDEEIISWRSEKSELYLLNLDYKALAPYELSDSLATVIKKSLKLCESSDGACDITVRALATLWGIEDKTEDEFTVPYEEDIRAVLDGTGYDKVHIKGNNITIDKEGIMLDLGAVGKGYALDCARDIISASYSGITGAVISVGGSVLVMGAKPDGNPWRIGIRNPKGAIDEMLGYIEILPNSSMCVSTSGNYEKYIEKDGVIYHHILDMSTGYPADTDLASVTVVCEDGLYSDGLSTACYVLGYEKSKSLLDEYGAKAVFIDNNNKVTVYGSLEFIMGD